MTREEAERIARACVTGDEGEIFVTYAIFIPAIADALLEAERAGAEKARAAEEIRFPTKPNWNSYGAKPTTPKAAETAKQIAVHRPTVVPTVNGGAQIEWHVCGLDMEIEIGPNGKPFCIYMSGGRE